jgi:uncharacterized membrane protein
MTRVCRITTISLLFLISISHPAQAEWTVCNKTPDNVWVAIAFDQGGGQFVSQGWWQVRGCGGCQVVHSGSFQLSGVWLRGQSDDGRVWEGNDLFCTKTNAFRVVGANNCNGRGLERKAFQLIKVNPQHQTTNLTGSSNSGKRCFD